MGGTSLRVMGAIRSRRAEKGAALVEMALILPLLVMLLLGITTAGIAYGQANALQTAAREGTRFAATYPDVSSNLSTVLNVTKRAAVGALDDTVPGQSICVAFVHPDAGTTQSLTQTGGGSPVAGTSPCFSDGRPGHEQRVQAVVGRDATINAALFSTTVSLESESAARYER